MIIWSADLFSPSCHEARLNDPIHMRQNFWMVFCCQFYTRYMLQIIAQVLTGLRDESKKDCALSELFSQGILSKWTTSLGEKGPIGFI